MMENAARHSRTAGPTTPSLVRRPVIARQRSELVTERKWPRAWRLLFAIVAAAALWLVFIFVARGV